jgi:alanine-glyoxylate transaminase/(R)-3-amino-2-methylpropionate-pyruvate transaminase
MLVEPIQGYGGVIPVPPGYQRRAAEIVRAAGGLYFSDEVQTGFGRTGKSFWAFEQDGVVPDGIVISKGIGNGLPIAALIVRREVAQAMAQRKFFNTYGANPVACAAGRAVLRAIADEHLQSNADRVGALFGHALEQAAAKHPSIGQVRGRGLMRGIELVADAQTRAPDERAAASLQEALRERGVIVGRSGQYRNVLRVNPPLCVTEQDAAEFAQALQDALNAESLVCRRDFLPSRPVIAGEKMQPDS